MNKRKLLIVISILAFIVIVGGISYSYFVYNKDVGNVSLTTGEISLSLSNVSSDKTLTNVIPLSDIDGKTISDYFDFTVNSTVDTEKIYYEVYLLPKSGNTLDTSYLKVYLTDQSDNLIKGVTYYSSLQESEKDEDGKVIYKGLIELNNNHTTKTETKDFRLRLWLDENYSEQASKTFEFDIYLYAKNVPEDFEIDGASMVRKAILAKQNAETNSCNPVWVDDNGTVNDETDDITYFSGTNDCVDMNYVWYSGKLWRITAIYPDGAMKLVTEDVITSIFWGSDVEYDGSWVYQWLNEDFYDTLVNPNNIIESTSTWNYSEDGNSTPVRPETIATQKTKTASVGLLNAYEYYNSYRCIGSTACTGSSYSTGYLNIGYYWWLITPYSTSYVRLVNFNGNLFSRNAPASNSFGVRPSINLKSGIEFTGDGTSSNPYKIVGDNEDAVNNTTLLSSRSVGEYVNFDNDIYRIVDTSNGITKLTRVDYLRDSGTVITKNFASTVYFGKSTNTQTDTYWDYYLNNTWYNSISTTYKNMLVDGTYYLGLYPDNTNYKATICKDANLNSVTIANCTKYTSSDADKTWTGKVGLPRVGEMFSSQLGSGYSTSSHMWTTTPYSTSYVRYISNNGLLSYAPASYSNGVRPSINLKSGIKITGGTGYVGGETNSPFEISE